MRIKVVVEVEVGGVGYEPVQATEEYLVEATVREWVGRRLARGFRREVTAACPTPSGRGVDNYEGLPVRADLVAVRDIDVASDCLWIEELLDAAAPVGEAFARLRERLARRGTEGD